MELDKLYDLMNLPFDTEVLYYGSPVMVKSVKNSSLGDIAVVKFKDGHSAEVMVDDLIETNMPIAEDEYILGWMTRYSPLIRS